MHSVQGLSPLCGARRAVRSATWKCPALINNGAGQAQLVHGVIGSGAGGGVWLVQIACGEPTNAQEALEEASRILPFFPSGVVSGTAVRSAAGGAQWR